MRGLIRSLIAIVSIGAGSWVGLHRAPPSADAAGSAAPSGSTAAGSPATPRPQANPDAPVSATANDAANAPELAPWPHLNPEANIAKAWRLAEGPHREPGDERRLVTLTFDDGPFPETTPKVLDLLAQYNVRATFFVIGRYLEGEGERAKASRETLSKVAEAGHLIGNHTQDHQLLTAISHTHVLEQIDRGAASIERAIGKKPILFRPPFGELDDFGQQAAQARGLDVLLWNIEVQDMERDDTQAMFRELKKQLITREGGVVLLHDIRWSSIRILTKLLAYLDSKKFDPAQPEKPGYEIVDLPTYLRAVEASPPQPRSRTQAGAAAKKPAPSEASDPHPRTSRTPRKKRVRPARRDET